MGRGERVDGNLLSSMGYFISAELTVPARGWEEKRSAKLLS